MSDFVPDPSSALPESVQQAAWAAQQPTMVPAPEPPVAAQQILPPPPIPQPQQGQMQYHQGGTLPDGSPIPTGSAPPVDNPVPVMPKNYHLLDPVGLIRKLEMATGIPGTAEAASMDPYAVIGLTFKIHELRVMAEALRKATK